MDSGCILRKGPSQLDRHVPNHGLLTQLLSHRFPLGGHHALLFLHQSDTHGLFGVVSSGALPASNSVISNTLSRREGFPPGPLLRSVPSFQTHTLGHKATQAEPRRSVLESGCFSDDQEGPIISEGGVINKEPHGVV